MVNRGCRKWLKAEAVRRGGGLRQLGWPETEGRDPLAAHSLSERGKRHNSNWLNFPTASSLPRGGVSVLLLMAIAPASPGLVIL